MVTGQPLSGQAWHLGFHLDPPERLSVFPGGGLGWFGRSALEIATIDMWLRRVEMVLMPPVGAVWVHTHPLTARLPMPRRADWGEDNRPRAIDALRWFDPAAQARGRVAAPPSIATTVPLMYEARADAR